MSIVLNTVTVVEHDGVIVVFSVAVRPPVGYSRDEQNSEPVDRALNIEYADASLHLDVDFFSALGIPYKGAI
jgi:hypothetical protein